MPSAPWALTILALVWWGARCCGTNENLSVGEGEWISLIYFRRADYFGGEEGMYIWKTLSDEFHTHHGAESVSSLVDHWQQMANWRHCSVIFSVSLFCSLVLYQAGHLGKCTQAQAFWFGVSRYSPGCCCCWLFPHILLLGQSKLCLD